MGLLKRWIALVVVVTGALGLAAPTSSASRKTDPIAVAACAGPPCTTPDNLSAPADGTGAELLPLPPAAALSAAIVVQPSQPKPPSADEAAFNELQTVLTSLPSARLRVAKCFLVGVSFLGYYVPQTTNIYTGQTIPGHFEYHYDEGDPQLATLFVAMCLQMVLDIQNSQPPKMPPALDVLSPLGPTPGNLASARCHQETLEIGVRVTRSGRRYLMHAYGTPMVPRGKSPLAISCRRTRTGLAISARPSARRRTLQQTFGKTLTIGFSNASTTSLALHTSVALR